MIRVLKIFFTSVLILSTLGCAESKEVTNENRSMHLSETGTTTCQLIEKPFVIKNGVVSENMELYLRCSIQDYYIKICESDVSEKLLRKYLNMGITVEMEIKEGAWDQCDEENEVQSRIGTYVTIKAIEN